MKKQSPKKKSVVSMPLVNPNAAGIDIGDTIHAVAVPVPEGRDKVQVKSFGAMTCDLQAIVKWLHHCKIDTVAMESTGVYWKPLFGMLIKAGFEVYLVNSKQAKNVSGRKNDEDDAMWIQKLHSCGLLRSSFLQMMSRKHCEHWYVIGKRLQWIVTALFCVCRKQWK